MPEHRSILGTRVDATSYNATTAQVLEWARAGESRYVCVATVNNIMTARRDPELQAGHNNADLVTPDGMPLAWGLRLLGLPRAERVVGAELMGRICEAATRSDVPIGLYGGAPDVLKALEVRLPQRYPGLRVAYAVSPPFRPLTAAEDRAVVEEINGSGAAILFVGLGCPKQELWMARHRPTVRAVMLGVGAAFDFLVGRVPRAPVWLQNAGLEWVFRLAVDPRRLWRRYVFQNPQFVTLFGAQVLRMRLRSLSRTGVG